MTPELLADIHARCFSTSRAWSPAEIASLIASPGSVLSAADGGFILGRVSADEAEILTLAVLPDHRRAGIGTRLLVAFEAEAAARGATLAHLEVAADNETARALYHRAGYLQSGSRPGYYRRSDGTRIDGLLLSKPLPEV